uniref:Uncharacterized protein n=1 Tax=Glossina brevipalpis TaxID=37001 RepID=A0A1A9W4K2_9MUSC
MKITKETIIDFCLLCFCALEPKHPSIHLQTGMYAYSVIASYCDDDVLVRAMVVVLAVFCYEMPIALLSYLRTQTREERNHLNVYGHNIAKRNDVLSMARAQRMITTENDDISIGFVISKVPTIQRLVLVVSHMHIVPAYDISHLPEEECGVDVGDFSLLTMLDMIDN